MSHDESDEYDEVRHGTAHLSEHCAAREHDGVHEVTADAQHTQGRAQHAVHVRRVPLAERTQRRGRQRGRAAARRCDI